MFKTSLGFILHLQSVLHQPTGFAALLLIINAVTNIGTDRQESDWAASRSPPDDCDALDSSPRRT